jgi:hypothetical protein
MANRKFKFKQCVKNVEHALPFKKHGCHKKTGLVLQSKIQFPLKLVKRNILKISEILSNKYLKNI